ncbi:hypothetical protein ACSFA8_22900 [Variovorax sp. RT4R15]|uniref:hypothetical protein n=1 Tax=Variovorax sp. RT4R15 TaxID=3443737 RepID=UPI003F48D304
MSRAPLKRGRFATVDDLAQLIDMLYAACFVVISYLVGPRASEILHLEAGCVQQRGDGTMLAAPGLGGRAGAEIGVPWSAGNSIGDAHARAAAAFRCVAWLA